MANRRYESDRYGDAEDRAGYFDRYGYPEELERGRYRELDWETERADDWNVERRRADARYAFTRGTARAGDLSAERYEPGRFAGYGPRGYRRSDQRIYEDVCERLTAHGDIDPTDLEVRVEEGVVALDGAVDSRYTRRLAEEVVYGVGGVQDVRNNLRIGARGTGAAVREPVRETISRSVSTGDRAALRETDQIGATVTDIPPVQAARATAGVERRPDTVVTALFRTRGAAQAAVERLVEAGYSRDAISILMSQQTGGREFGFSESSKAPEGAATGAAIGGVLGAIAAGLAAVGTIAIPGLGLVAAGPILAALAGAGAGGAAGSIIGALAGAGIPEHEAKFYSDAIEAGGILVSLQTDGDRTDAAEQIFKSAGGESVTHRGI